MGPKCRTRPREAAQGRTRGGRDGEEGPIFTYFRRVGTGGDGDAAGGLPFAAVARLVPSGCGARGARGSRNGPQNRA